MGMGGGTSKRDNLGTILLNEVKDFALGAVYEQTCSTYGFFARNAVNILEDNMAYQSTMASLGFAAGAVLDGVMIHQAMEGSTLAKYILAGKAISVATSFTYDQAKKITKRLQK